MKRCSRCNQEKNSGDFQANKVRRDGLSVYCLLCTKTYNNQRYRNKLSYKNCGGCKKEIFTPLNRKYCGSFCRFKNRRKGIDGYKNCKYCEVKFPYRNSLKIRGAGEIRSPRTKFCSNKCKMGWLFNVYLPNTWTDEKRKITGERLKKVNKGKKLSLEDRVKRSLRYKGKSSHFWKGGVTPINKQIRSSLVYKLWREAVFKRDNWACQICKKRGGRLHADHIKPFAYFPNLRFDINNGRALCVECHKNTPTYLKNDYS